MAAKSTDITTDIVENAGKSSDLIKDGFLHYPVQIGEHFKVGIPIWQASTPKGREFIIKTELDNSITIFPKLRNILPSPTPLPDNANDVGPVLYPIIITPVSKLKKVENFDCKLEIGDTAELAENIIKFEDFSAEAENFNILWADPSNAEKNSQDEQEIAAQFHLETCESPAIIIGDEELSTLDTAAAALVGSSFQIIDNTVMAPSVIVDGHLPELLAEDIDEFLADNFFVNCFETETALATKALLPKINGITINTLSVQEIRDLDLGAESVLQSSKAQNLQAKLENQVSDLANMKALMPVYSKIWQTKESTEVEKKIVTDFKKTIDLLSADIAVTEAKLNAIMALKKSHKATLELPNFGDVEDVNLEHLTMAVANFSGIDNVTLDETWSKLLVFGESLQLAEAAYKKALGTILQGEAFLLYKIYRDKDLSEILINLTRRFGGSPTLGEILQNLEDFSRAENETLISAITRAGCLLDQTRHTVAAELQDHRKLFHLEMLLLKIAAPAAKNAMSKMRAKAAKLGLTITYENLLEIARENDSIGNSKYLQVHSVKRPGEFLHREGDQKRVDARSEPTTQQNFERRVATPVRRLEARSSGPAKLAIQDFSSTSRQYNHVPRPMQTNQGYRAQRPTQKFSQLQSSYVPRERYSYAVAPQQQQNSSYREPQNNYPRTPQTQNYNGTSQNSDFGQRSQNRYYTRSSSPRLDQQLQIGPDRFKQSLNLETSSRCRVCPSHDNNHDYHSCPRKGRHPF